MMRKITYLGLLLLLSGALSAKGADDAFFEQLDLGLPQLGQVRALYQNNQPEKALGKFLELYRSKENLYLRAGANDVEHISKVFKEDVQKTIKTADEVLNRYFLFRYEWDMEKTNVPYQFEEEIDWTAILLEMRNGFICSTGIGSG